MSILAAPRKKQRISIDPQNVAWKTSESIGKNLMSKMNWSEGKGLGKNEQGSSENLKLNANFTGKGLGCDRDTFMKQQQWIAHHDDFASLLANLNNKSTKDNSTTDTNSNEEDNSIQKRSRNMKSRMHYKFTKGKDLTLATDKHKTGIFGKVSTESQKKSDQEPKDVQEVKSEQKETVSTFETNTSQLITVSTISTNDYYKEKMAKWLSKRSTVTTEETNKPTEVKQEVSVEIVEESRKKKKDKKRKRELEEIESEAITETVEEESRKKKKDKKRKRELEEVEPEGITEVVEEESRKEKKKKRKRELIE